MVSGAPLDPVELRKDQVPRILTNTGTFLLIGKIDSNRRTVIYIRMHRTLDLRCVFYLS